MNDDSAFKGLLAAGTVVLVAICCAALYAGFVVTPAAKQSITAARAAATADVQLALADTPPSLGKNALVQRLGGCIANTDPGAFAPKPSRSFGGWRVENPAATGRLLAMDCTTMAAAGHAGDAEYGRAVKAAYDNLSKAEAANP